MIEVSHYVVGIQVVPASIDKLNALCKRFLVENRFDNGLYDDIITTVEGPMHPPVSNLFIPVGVFEEFCEKMAELGYIRTPEKFTDEDIKKMAFWYPEIKVTHV